MRLPLTILLSAGLISTGVLADEQQVPLKEKAAGWLDKAKSYIPSGVADPIDVGAAAVAAKKVERITDRNWARKLQPKLEGEEEWLIYLTGGNKSCFGRCEPTDAAWNQSVALLSALPQPAGAPPLRLGMLDCEANYVLCCGWAAAVPAIWHFEFPQRPADPKAPTPQSPLRIVELSFNVTAPQIAQLARSSPEGAINDFPIYTGAWHPLDGWLAKTGLQYYLGLGISLMGTTPSWLIMLGISFFSRQFIMNRNTHGRPGMPSAPAGGAAPAPASPQPAAVPAAAGKGTPGSAGKGGKKKR